jgi:hypothetical protein
MLSGREKNSLACLIVSHLPCVTRALPAGCYDDFGSGALQAGFIEPIGLAAASLGIPQGIEGN